MGRRIGAAAYLSGPHRFLLSHAAVLPDTLTLFARLGAALAIGLLVGLQRQYAGHREHGEGDLFAGVRTFALFALLGGLAAYAGLLLESAAAFAAAVLLVGAFVAVAYSAGVRRGEIGLTTEMAAIVTLLAGALCVWGELAVAAAVGVTTTVLLAFKPEAHRFAHSLTHEDVVATLKFAAISVLVLPVLPDEPVGPPPFDALTPFTVWLMVVFISGISFLGYVLIKTIGARRGIGLTGLLGGIASSTAVTLTFAERSRGQDALAGPLALGIVIAWTIMFARVLVEVAAVNAPLLADVWLPIVAGGAAGLAYAGFLFLGRKEGGAADDGEPNFANPFELKPALTFGALYAVILVVARAAQLYFGDTGVYVSAIASGVADVDAITLSLAELSRGEGGLTHDTAALAIVLAAMSNTVVKGGIVVAVGSSAMRRAILPAVGVIVAAALAVAFVA